MVEPGAFADAFGQRLVGRGQHQRDRRALAGARGDLGAAAGLSGEAVDLRQAEPGALADLLGGEEGLERAVDHVGGHAARRCR